MTYHIKSDIRNAIRIAKQLHYGQPVIDRLEKATSESEITRIMGMARRGEI